MRNKSQNLPCCSSLQSVVVYSFTEIESTFPMLFWDYVADCLWLCDVVSIRLMRKDKQDWFLNEGLLLDSLIFFFISAAICLLLKIFCQDNTFFILKSVSSFPTSCSSCSISEFLLIFVNLISQSFSWSSQENFINFSCVFTLHGLVCWRLTLSK